MLKPALLSLLAVLIATPSPARAELASAEQPAGQAGATARKPRAGVFADASNTPGLLRAQLPKLLTRRKARRVNRRVSAALDGRVTITNPAGSVVVVGWDEPAVEIEGTLGAYVRRLEFTREDDEVIIAVISRATHPMGDEADIEVRIPQNSRVDIRTFLARIDVAGVDGPVDTESMSGGIVISGGPRQVHAECISCDMDIATQCEMVRAEALNGTIQVSQACGVVDLSTVSGKVILASPKADRVNVSSVSGDLLFHGSVGPNGSVYFETHRGRIDLLLPQAVVADFDVQNYRGTVLSDFAHQRLSTAEGLPVDLRFSTGAGGGRFKVRSFSGPVVLRKE